MLYLQYFDKGSLLAGLQEYFRSPEMAEAMKNYGVNASSMKAELDAVSMLRPVDVAFSMISNTLITGLVCSVIIALLSRREPKKVVRR